VIRRRLLIGSVVLAVVLAPSAGGATERSLPIRLGVGIGPVNLEMTGQQVRRALGKPTAVIERRVIGGRPYVELDYGYGRWNVGLLGRPGERRVVLLGTGLSRHKTPEGIGVGSAEHEFWRRLRGRGYRQRSCPGNRRLHWFVRRGATETIFFPHWREEGVQATISAVEVRGAATRGCAF
jgi:hypothetical protein